MPFPAIVAATTKIVEGVKKAEKVVSQIDKTAKIVEKTTAPKDSNWGTNLLTSTVKKNLSDKLGNYFNQTSEGCQESEQSTTDDELNKGIVGENDSTPEISESSKKMSDKNYDCQLNDSLEEEQLNSPDSESEIPVKGLEERLNNYFKSIDDSAEPKEDNSKSDFDTNDEEMDEKNQNCKEIDFEDSQENDGSDENAKEKKVDDTANNGPRVEYAESPIADLNTLSEEKHDVIDKELRDLTEEEKQVLKNAGMSEENIKKCKVDENGKVHLKTINCSIDGKEHPETGVKYERKTINLNGIEVEGVFPEFDSVFECELSEELLIASDDDQFTECMKQLKEAIEKDPKFASNFSDKQLERIMDGTQPRLPGYTWHHNEVTGKMELVKDFDHQKSNHTGGKSIWGGGQDNR